MFKICKTIQDFENEAIVKAGGRPSHNYIKRTGAAGNYKYWYKLPNGHVVSSDKDSGAPHVDHSKEMDTDERHSGAKPSESKNKDKEDKENGSLSGEIDDKKKYVVIGFLLGILDEYEGLKSIDNLLSKLESDHITGGAALDFLYNEAPDELKTKIDDVREEYGFDNYDKKTKKVDKGSTEKKEVKVKKSNERENIMDDLFKTFRLTPTVVEHDNEEQFGKSMDSYVQNYFKGENERIVKSTTFESTKAEVAPNKSEDLILTNEELLVALHIDSMFKRD